MKVTSFFSREPAKPAPVVNIQNLRIASPCSADWNQMPGNDRVRHCEACNLNVYNFSAMTEPEIKRLVAEREGRLCALMYRRTDGTMLTQNCPVGLKALTRRLSRIAGAVLAAMLPNFVAVPPVAGQSYTRTNVGDATIQLQVVDPQGAVIPDASVTLTPLPDGKPIQSKTDKHGQLLLRQPRAGRYRLEVSYPGFQSDPETVELRAGEILSFQVRLYIRLMGVVVEVETSRQPDKSAVPQDMAATPSRSAPRPMQR